MHTPLLPRRPHSLLGTGVAFRLYSHRELVPGPVTFGQRTPTPATAGRTKAGVPGRAAAVAPVEGVALAPAPAPAAGEDAAPRRDAG